MAEDDKMIMTIKQLKELDKDIEDGVAMIVEKRHYYRLEGENKNLRSLCCRILRDMPIATLTNLSVYVRFKDRLIEDFGKDFLNDLAQIK